ncbi:MAG: TRAP transporter small permease subunit, partial [Bacteroidota bacterium]
FSPKQKAWLNLIGTFVFLIPFCVIMLWTGWDFAARSWRIGEISAEPNGLPARFLVKSTILIGFALLFLQSISLLAKSMLTIKDHSP